MMTSSDDWFTLTVPAELRILPLIRALVDVVAGLAGFSKEDAYAIKLAAVEACANSILHGYKDRPTQPLSLACCILPGGLQINVRDQGEPFDIQSVPHLDPAEVRRGGRGVMLIRAVMDEVTSSPPAAGGNDLRLFKRLPSAEKH